jgi:hypothetical protein
VNRFKKPVSFLLLLLFIRIMLPEKAILELHRHKHTEHGHLKNDIGYQLDTKHTHCPIDELFHSCFVPERFPIILSSVLIFTDIYSANHTYFWKFTFPNNNYLRGPPAV